MIGPDFLIIGAARTGTTSLYLYLQQHPEIFLPEKKRPEPHFFLKNKEFSKGFEYYVKKYFLHAPESSIKGEASTSYLFMPYVPKRIKKYLPECKLIIMLRNPIERAVSNYTVSYKNGIEALSFNEAIRNEKFRMDHPKDTFESEVRPFSYVSRGLYFQQIKNYLDVFDMKNIHIIFFDDFISNPVNELKKAISFLGVRDKNFCFNILDEQNSSDDMNIELSNDTKKFIFRLLENDIKKLSLLLNRDLRRWLVI